jgi:hypothetical protein
MTAIWLLAGTAAAGGVFWAFLSTPESNIFTLALSAILLLVLFVIAAVTVNGAVLAWRQRGWSGATLSGAVGGINAFVIPVLLVTIAWALSVLGVAWVERHRGEIGAVFIARAGWSNVTPLFTAVEWAGWWITWVAAPMMALAWLGRALAGVWRPDWLLLRQALSPLRLLAATAAFVALVYLPWVYLVPWRPRWLPADTMELLFATVKLGLFAVMAGIGAALMIRAAVAETADSAIAVAAPQPPTPGPPTPDLDLHLAEGSASPFAPPERPGAAGDKPVAPAFAPPDDPGATAGKPEPSAR